MKLKTLHIDYFVCSKCAFERFESDDESAHQWWHSLFLLREDLLISAPSDLSTEVVVGDKAQKAVPLEVTDHGGTLIVDTINDRMSALEEKLRQLDSAIHSSSSALETKLEVTNASMESKVAHLEAKMDHIMAALKDLLGSLPPTGKTPSD